MHELFPYGVHPKATHLHDILLYVTVFPDQHLAHIICCTLYFNSCVFITTHSHNIISLNLHIILSFPTHQVPYWSSWIQLSPLNIYLGLLSHPFLATGTAFHPTLPGQPLVITAIHMHLPPIAPLSIQRCANIPMGWSHGSQSLRWLRQNLGLISDGKGHVWDGRPSYQSLFPLPSQPQLILKNMMIQSPQTVSDLNLAKCRQIIIFIYILYRIISHFTGR